jgi:hypothetical protein
MLEALNHSHGTTAQATPPHEAAVSNDRLQHTIQPMSHSVQTRLQPFTRFAIVLLVLSPLALAVPVLLQPAYDDAPMAATVALAPLAKRESDELLKVEDVRPITGFALNAHHISDLSLYLDSVDRIADMGANALIVLTPMMQKHVTSNTIEFKPDKCATDAQLIAIFQRARERGLHTTLLPIVLLENPGEKDWRGVIRPTDWEQWWESYDAFVDRFVDVANGGNVDLLVIGSELNSTENEIERWKTIATRVREAYQGQITYSANWDRYDKIKFWNLVDVMCVSSYFELERDNPSAAETEIAEAWAHERDELLRFAKRQNRPLLLSEVGYPSLPWASAHPWNYITPKGSKADHEAQARCWRAFFRAWVRAFDDADGLAAGFFGYCWSPYYSGDAWDTGYGVKGKPAYEVLRNGFARIRSGPPDSRVDRTTVQGKRDRDPAGGKPAS